MQGSEEVGSVGPAVRGAIKALTGPGKPRSATNQVGATAVTGTVDQVTAGSMGSAGSTGMDALALSHGLTAADARMQAQRAAQLLKIVGSGAATVDVHMLARVLDREGVILP